jgi:hypothetical protein
VGAPLGSAGPEHAVIAEFFACPLQHANLDAARLQAGKDARTVWLAQPVATAAFSECPEFASSLRT